jgi:hypothetical protein
MVGQSLPNNTTKRLHRPQLIVTADRRPRIIAEIEFRQIATKVLFADVVERSDDAALHDREITLDGVGVPEASADLFLSAMVHRAVTGEGRAQFRVNRAFVGHQVRGFGDASV